jgi:hypothetical protein
MGSAVESASVRACARPGTSARRTEAAGGEAAVEKTAWWEGSGRTQGNSELRRIKREAIGSESESGTLKKGRL